MVGGQQSARSLVASGRAVPPRRPRRPAARSRACAAPHGPRAGRARDRLMRDSRGRSARTCRSTRRRCASSSRCLPSSRPARGAASAPSVPGATRCRPPGSPRRHGRSGMPASALGLLPRRLLPGCRCRRPARRAGGQPQGRRRGQGARRRRAWCWWWARCPARSPGKPASQGHRPGPRPGARRHRRHPGVRQERRHAARHRAAASHAGRRARLHQHAGAGARHLRCARPGAAPARSAWRSTSITCWWDPKLEARSPAPARKRLLAYHVCDWLVPTRDLLNDRGMMGDGIIELQKGARPGSRPPATRAPSRSRSSPTAGGPPRRGGAGHLRRALQVGGVVHLEPREAGRGRGALSFPAGGPMDAPPTDPALLSATELVALYRAKKLSPWKPLRPRWRASSGSTRSSMRTAISMPRARWPRQGSRRRAGRAGNPKGLVDGVPVGVKDNIHVAGMPSRFGSRLTPDSPQKIDRPRWRDSRSKAPSCWARPPCPSTAGRRRATAR